ncbi:MAG: sulfotransferase family 2 domain-containing protein [Chloroflexaceae bacterium]|nr:sulfotransferase family 2 domain-containing protein [Chloroflexaceae bacterium]
MSLSHYNPQAVILFIHIFKTAGTTLNWIIDQNYQPEHQIKINYPRRKLRYHAFNSAHKKPVGALSETEFMHVLDEPKKKLHIISGHIGVGFHAFLPEDTPFQYMLLLRDPIDRLISFYYQVQRSPNVPLHSPTMTLEDFVLHPSHKNFQTRVLVRGRKFDTWLHGMHEAPILTEADLEDAKNHLQNNYFLLAGISERFDEFLLLLKQTLGWPNIFYLNQNVTRERASTEQLSPAVRRQLVEEHALDLQLYDYVSEQFDALVQQQGELFQHQLRQFRRLNTLYNRVYHARQRLNQIKHRALPSAS